MIPFSQLPTIPDSDIRGITRLAAETTDSNGVAYTGTVTVDQLFNEGGTGCQCVYVASLILTSAQVLALNTTPVAFGITVPTGYFIRLVNATAYMNYGTTPYATNGRLGIRTVGATDAHVEWSASGFLFGTVTRFTTPTDQATGTITGTSFLIDADLEAFVQIGNPTAGDSDITIYVSYLLIQP